MESKNKKIEFSTDLPSVALGKDSLPSVTTIALGKTGHNWAKLAQVPDLPSAMVTALGETGHFAEC